MRLREYDSEVGGTSKGSRQAMRVPELIGARIPTSSKAPSPRSLEEHQILTMKTGESSELYSAADGPIQSGHTMARRKYSPSALTDPKVSIVIPVYNEKNTIDEILRRVIDTETRKEVIIVDDCSTDGTRERLKTMATLQAKG